MKLQDQVCTIEQAKRLKELGLSQESLFYHYMAPRDNGCDAYWETSEIAYNPWFVNASNPEDESDGCTYYVDGTDQYSAFTVAELFTMLPASIQFAKKWVDLRITRNDVQQEHGGGICYTVGYCTSDKELLRDWVYGNGAESLLEAAGEMLIMLIERGILKVEEINQRFLNS